MPLRLPPGYIPTFVPVSDDAVLRGDTGRFTDFRIDILVKNVQPGVTNPAPPERKIGVLDGVQPGGSLEWSASSSIKGSGKITVTDVGQRVDWLNVRLQPYLLTEGYSAPEWPLSVWLASAPSESWSDTGRVWEVELLDKLSILDQDVYTNASGQITSYSAKTGNNVVNLIRGLITGAGESAAGILGDTTTLTQNMVWDAGTTRLKIINDILNAANFFSLFVDNFGYYRVERYKPPGERPVAYESLGPFTHTGVMAPEWSKDDDIYAVPNRVVCISAADGDIPALTAIATNTDPESRFSYANRGNRWITRVETGVEAINMAALQAQADRLLVSSTGKASTFDIQHLVLPELSFNSVVRLINPDAHVNELCSVTNTSIPLDPLALSSTHLSEVLAGQDQTPPAPEE